MKPFSVALFAVLLAGAALPASAQTQTQAPGLVLSTGKVFTDAAGAYISVSVKNAGTATVAEAYVACEFFAGNRTLGKAATTVFSIVGGMTGSDQVRMLGASRATRAACAITGQK
ncbi:hypothetical protein EZH22_08295 [Xanthobacter dioxanivorans]|uniref:CARDB domain-containing protein n=1 Tax=Xanthobacter dioxanivorans TaxID=2528964 RepID=A0A974SJZ0_9HYPH|nr:hypothetical protein [Xanthobacter dioxanivorans]QRG08290.1 hypothetical protein EZH22_08295 [Xanthobacter dioxanivorans]